MLIILKTIKINVMLMSSVKRKRNFDFSSFFIMTYKFLQIFVLYKNVLQIVSVEYESFPQL